MLNLAINKNNKQEVYLKGAMGSEAPLRPLPHGYGTVG